jgi:general secretion pathway protein L
MAMISELKELFGEWVAAVERAINSIASRFMPRQRILLIEEDSNMYTAEAAPNARGAALPEVSFRISNGRPDPVLPPEWETALQGSRVEILIKSDRVLFRALDFPGRAVDFLDGMIRAQIDRLTPWSANEAVFSWSPPSNVANDRIALTLAATSKSNLEPLVQLARNLGAACVAGFAEAPLGEGAMRFKIFETSLQSAIGRTVDVPRLLRIILLGSGVAATASLAIAAYVGNTLETERQQLSRRIAERRASLRIGQGGVGTSTLLAKRKQTTPSSVMALESISRALPDSTYVTELRIEGDKVQVVGVSQDAPALIRLIEQSPQFSRATFSAPTTRAQGDPGEHFHIEVHVAPYFGSGS